MAGADVDATVAGSSADARARAVEEQMTDDERFSLLVSVMGVNTVVTVRDRRIPEGIPMSAGYVPGIPRLGVPALLMSDASLGVTNPGYREGDTATALPAGIALGASFNPALALRLTSATPTPTRTAPVAIPAPSLRTGLVGGSSRKQITAG